MMVKKNVGPATAGMLRTKWFPTDDSSMIRQADDVHVSYDPLPFGQGWLVLHVGAEGYRMRCVDKADFRRTLRWSEETPQRVATFRRDACWIFRGRYFWSAADARLAHIRTHVGAALPAT